MKAYKKDYHFEPSPRYTEFLTEISPEKTKRNIEGLSTFIGFYIIDKMETVKKFKNMEEGLEVWRKNLERELPFLSKDFLGYYCKSNFKEPRP